MRLLPLNFLSVVLLLPKCDAGDDDDYGEECNESCAEDEDEKHGKLGDHCYYWSTVTKKWEEAEYHCQSKGGHLAAVTNLEIHNFLMKRVNKDERYTWFWIGGSDKEAEDTWKWVDGSPWNLTQWASEPKQQPDRAAKRHDCLQIYHNQLATNGWNDQKCELYHYFICGWKICPGFCELSLNFYRTQVRS